MANNNFRLLAHEIVNKFDELLMEKGMSVPCESKYEEEHRQENGVYGLYGTEYGVLVDKVEALMIEHDDPKESLSQHDGILDVLQKLVN
jgi:hypothetical protein